ncbi:hypothetical protein WA158_005262 [Blastocystis sp. Blastoise]
MVVDSSPYYLGMAIDSLEGVIKKISTSIEFSLQISLQELRTAQGSFINKVDTIKKTMETASPKSYYHLFSDPENDIYEDQDQSFGVYYFPKNNTTYKIEKPLVDQYPDSLLSTSLQTESYQTEHQCVFSDHSDYYFPMITAYLKKNPIDFAGLDMNTLETLYDEFKYYKLPVPESLNVVDHHRQIKSMWNQQVFNVNVCGEIYTIDRNDLKTNCITKSYFNMQPISELEIDIENNALKVPQKVDYFHYVADYIKTGVLEIKRYDFPMLDAIQNTFNDFSIGVLRSEWNKFESARSSIECSLILPLDSHAYLKKWLGNKPWTLLYRGSRDSFTPESFHYNCDDMGETIVLIKSISNNKVNIFGGYTSISWKSPSDRKAIDYVRDPKAFIFTLQNSFQIMPTKFKCIRSDFAHVNSVLYGPSFGKGDLTLFGEQLEGYTSFGGSSTFYNSTNKGMCLFTNTGEIDNINHFIINEIEVYGCRSIETISL